MDFCFLLGNMLKDLESLIFPKICAACKRTLTGQEHVICLNCALSLPKTRNWLDPANTVARKLWGRVSLNHTSAYLQFMKRGMVQELMHQLKYADCPEVGVHLGKLYGSELKYIFDKKLPDLLVPVPLHPRKLKKRGYNQSETIARGISEITGIPIDTRHLLKTNDTGSQTQLSRWSRWLNLKESFYIDDRSFFEHRHVVLVDDVVTTGATIEGCANLFRNIPHCSLSAVFLATAL